MNVRYTIDNVEHVINVSDEQNFLIGDDIILSNENTDITFNQKWYNEGFTIEKIFSNDNFLLLKDGITKTIIKIINENTQINTNGFTLEKYHNYVKTNEEHFKIVSKTRDLFPKDFNFNIIEILSEFEKTLGFKLSDIDSHTNEPFHIIIRINRPNSFDYNPPHKDMYESYDDGCISLFLNFWVPICGVTKKSSLPVVPKSHKLPENLILRTVEGGLVSNNKYRVRFVKSWDNKNDLVRVNINYGDVLIFSSHLVHGLAINNEDDITRVALEFRLFKK